MWPLKFEIKHFCSWVSINAYFELRRSFVYLVHKTIAVSHKRKDLDFEWCTKGHFWFPVDLTCNILACVCSSRTTWIRNTRTNSGGFHWRSRSLCRKAPRERLRTESRRFFPLPPPRWRNSCRKEHSLKTTQRRRRKTDVRNLQDLFPLHFYVPSLTYLRFVRLVFYSSRRRRVCGSESRSVTSETRWEFYICFKFLFFTWMDPHWDLNLNPF